MNVAAIPDKKITLGGATGAAVIVVMWMLNTYVTASNPIPAEIGAALTTVATFAVSCLVKP